MSLKICLLGPVSPPVSGPGVKNKIMLDWFNSHENIRVINTYRLRNLNFATYLKSIIDFITSDIILLSVSQNGRFIFIPLCYIFRKKCILFPAGGSFHLEINKLSRLKRQVFLRALKKIKRTYVQTKVLKFALEELGLENVFYFPNPRVDRKKKAKITYSKVFKIIFLSKIRKGKGPLLLMEAVEEVRKLNSEILIELDFYGLIDNSFKDEFYENLECNVLNKYCGVVPPESVQPTISEYHLFVLPTSFPEGVPGAVLEAMFTGIPIIVSNFTSAKDLITDSIEGTVLVDCNKDNLVSAILDLLKNETKRNSYSINVREKAKDFEIDFLMNQLRKEIKKIN